MSADRITPLEAPSPIHALTEEVRQLKMQTSRLADAAMIATSKIPELEQKIARISSVSSVVSYNGDCSSHCGADMAPLTEQNNARRPHPGAEPVEPVDVGPSDDATIRAIRGKGIVATITPHFAVAVIVGLATAFVARKPDSITTDVGSEARRCNESVTQLRADFTQFKAETALHNISLESKMNEILSRTWNPAPGQPVQASQFAPGVSRALRGE